MVESSDVEDQAAELEPDAVRVPAREVVATWTGVESRALREAMRLSVGTFTSTGALGLGRLAELSAGAWGVRLGT